MLTANAIDMLKDKIKRIERDGKMIYLVGPVKLPINLYGETVIFKWYCWLLSNEVMDSTEEMIRKLASVNLAEMQQSSVLVYGDFENADDAAIRMHSICHTGDIFGSKRCDCGYQLKESLKMIVDHGAGALFYLANHEGRGIGLFSKAMAYVLQENGMDTVEANLSLGFKDDARNYEDAIEVLKFLRTKPVTIITNNPRKIEALHNSDLNISDREPLWGDVSEYNQRYLQTKINRSGHYKGGQPHE
jgi:GTP cyclohydrolase II